MKTITLDFIAKDSVPFHREINVPDDVYDELKKLVDAAPKGGEVFNLISSADVSAFLKEVAPISPKVLRTAKCNRVLVEELKKQNVTAESSEQEKVRALYRANLEIAKTLNHQKNVAKNYAEQEKKAKDAVTDSKLKMKEAVAKQKERLASLKEDEKKAKVRYANTPIVLKETIAKLKEKRAKYEEQLRKSEARLEKAQFNLEKKQETKDINLSTSLGAYADYRIIYSWCNEMKLDPSKIYNKALLEKSATFANTSADFWRSI